MKVYHGGYCPIEIPEIIIGKYDDTLSKTDS